MCSITKGHETPTKQTQKSLENEEVFKTPRNVDKPALFDFADGYREDRTALPRAHSLDKIPGLQTNFNDVQLPDFFYKKRVSTSTSLWYL